MSEIVASMAGNVWKVLVKAGDQVEEGQGCSDFRINENGNSDCNRIRWDC